MNLFLNEEPSRGISLSDISAAFRVPCGSLHRAVGSSSESQPKAPMKQVASYFSREQWINRVAISSARLAPGDFSPGSDSPPKGDCARTPDRGSP